MSMKPHLQAALHQVKDLLKYHRIIKAGRDLWRAFSQPFLSHVYATAKPQLLPDMLTPQMCFSGVLCEIPQEEQLENIPASEEKSKT